MENCRFCQKSKLIDRTLMKCGWSQYSAMVAAETTAAAMKARAAMPAISLVAGSSFLRSDQTMAAANSGPR